MEFASRAVRAVLDDGFAVAAVIQQDESVQRVGVFQVLDGRLGVGDFGGDEGFSGSFAEGVHGEPHDDSAAHDEAGTPDEVGPSAGLETARENIGRRENADEPATGHEITEEGCACVVTGNEFRTAEDHRGGRHDHEDKNREKRHGETRGEAEAVFEEFRNRVDAGAEEAGQKEKRHQHERDGGHPFVGRHGHSQPVRGRAGHADELLRRDIRGDQRKADEPPSETATGEEVAAGAGTLATFIAGFPDAKRNHADYGDGE